MLSEQLGLWKERFGAHMRLCGRAARTTANYVAELPPFFAFLDTQGVESLANLTRGQVESYRTHLYYRRWRDKSLTLATQAKRLAAVKAFLRFLVKAGYLLVNPAAELELPHVPRPLPRANLSEREVLRLLAAVDTTEPLGLRDRAILELLYGTGIRNTELCELRLDEVDLEHREVCVRKGKGSKSRMLPLGEEAWAWLEAYLEKERPNLVQSPNTMQVFLSWRGRIMDRGSLSQVVRRAGERAGFEAEVTPHVLRHLCATHMLKRGAGLRHLQVLLGHESLATTQRYTKLDLTDLRKVVQRCHPRERSPR